MKRTVGIGCVLATLLLVPAVAFADEGDPQPRVTESETATSDTVHLRSGGIVRGRVTEIVAGDHVSVLVAPSVMQHVPWADVERVIVTTTKFPPRPPPPRPAATPPPAPVGPPPMVGPRAYVHLESKGAAYLYRRAAGTTEFVTACESPCDTELPLGDTYKIGGSGLKTTPEFRLKAAPGGEVRLTVDGANWLGIVAGGAMIVVGAVPLYVGLLLAPLLSVGGDASGIVLGCLGIGGAAVGIGAVVLITSMRTDFSQKPLEPAKDAFVRTPLWRAPPTSASATFPVLFERRF
jgi:hypothetical protein